MPRPTGMLRKWRMDAASARSGKGPMQALRIYCFLHKHMNFPVSKGSNIMRFWLIYLRSTLKVTFLKVNAERMPPLSRKSIGTVGRKDTGTESETLPKQLSALNSRDFFLISEERMPPLPKKHRDVPPRKSIGTVGRNLRPGR